jgi:nitrogen fixation NifU-like protein
MAYSNKVLDHYNNPRNVGSMDKSDPNVGTGMVGAPECGDVMKLQVKVNPDTGVIEDAKFKTFGCGSAIASSSLATEWLRGKTVDEALQIKNTDIVNELSLPPVKIHCSVLAEDAIKAAILSIQVRCEAAGHRPSVRVRRCESLCGSQEHGLSGRHDARLEGLAHPLRLRIRQPARQEELWLRNIVFRLTEFSA